MFSYLKAKRETMSRRKERRTIPTLPYSFCSTERESKTLTAGVCGWKGVTLNLLLHTPTMRQL